jgi:hypothetical protein
MADDVSDTTAAYERPPGERWTDGKYVFEVGGAVAWWPGMVELTLVVPGPLDQATLPTLFCPPEELTAGRARARLGRYGGYRVAIWRVT